MKIQPIQKQQSFQAKIILQPDFPRDFRHLLAKNDYEKLPVPLNILGLDVNAILKNLYNKITAGEVKYVKSTTESIRHYKLDNANITLKRGENGSIKFDYDMQSDPFTLSNIKIEREPGSDRDFDVVDYALNYLAKQSV